MRALYSSLLAILFLLQALGPVGGQAPSTQTSTATSSAATFAQSANQQAGWALDWSTMGFAYTGEVISAIPAGSTPSPIAVAVEFQGRSNAKLTTHQNGSTATTVVSGQASWTTTSSGTQPMPFDAMYDSLAIFPFLSDLTALSDSAISVSDGGIVPLGGGNAHLVTIHRAVPTDLTLSRRLSRQPTDTNVWIATDTVLPIQSENYRPGIDNSSANVLVHWEYEDYKVVNGIAVPFTIRQFMNGSLVSTVFINSIQFGLSFPASEFTVQN